MKTFLKTLLYLFCGGFIFLCLILNVHAQTKIKNDLVNNLRGSLNTNNIMLESPIILGQRIDSENDGAIYTFNADYYVGRTATTADAIFNDTIIGFATYDDSSEQYITLRSPVQFDLSGIDLSKIVSATLNLYPLGDDSPDYFASSTEIGAFFRGGQANPFTTDDYQNFDNGDKYTDSIDYTTLKPGQFNSFALNTNGIDYLKSGGNKFMLVNEDYDIASTTPPNFSELNNVMVAFAGSVWYAPELHPYLDLVLSSTSTPPVESTSSCSVVKNNDISIISGCSSVVDQNGTTTTYFSYYIPAILYFFVYSLMVIMLVIISTIYPIFRLNKNRK
jgi:hypothetical protein